MSLIIFQVELHAEPHVRVLHVKRTLYLLKDVFLEDV